MRLNLRSYTPKLIKLRHAFKIFSTEHDYKPIASARLQYHYVYIRNDQILRQNYTKIFTQTHHIEPFSQNFRGETRP